MRERPNGGPDSDEVFRSAGDIRGGVACFTGTRVGVSQLLGYLRDGYTIDDFLRDFPTMTKDQAQRAIERVDNEYVRMEDEQGDSFALPRRGRETSEERTGLHGVPSRLYLIEGKATGCRRLVDTGGGGHKKGEK